MKHVKTFVFLPHISQPISHLVYLLHSYEFTYAVKLMFRVSLFSTIHFRLNDRTRLYKSSNLNVYKKTVPDVTFRKVNVYITTTDRRYDADALWVTPPYVYLGYKTFRLTFTLLPTLRTAVNEVILRNTNKKRFVKLYLL